MKKEIDIDIIKGNPKNPRKINPAKLASLKESINGFAKMMRIRPIVVNEEMVVLGGHQRLAACKELGFKKVWIQQEKDLTEAEQREFSIKDNVSSGEWDQPTLTENFNTEELILWGFDENDLPKNGEDDNIMPEVEFSECLNESNNYVVLFFDNDIDWLNAQQHFNLKSVNAKRANGKPWSKGIGRVIDGAKYITKLHES